MPGILFYKKNLYISVFMREYIEQAKSETPFFPSEINKNLWAISVNAYDSGKNAKSYGVLMNEI